MKRSLLIAAGAAFAVIAVSVFVCVNNGKNEMDDLFNANVEALAKIEEPETVNVPCSIAVNRTCFFVITDIYGNSHPASISGMKNGE